MKSYAEKLEEFKKQTLTEYLEETRGNVTRAAKLAGRNRTEFYKVMKRHGLDFKNFRVSRRRDGLV